MVNLCPSEVPPAPHLAVRSYGFPWEPVEEKSKAGRVGRGEEAAGLTVRTLHYYDEIVLLVTNPQEPVHVKRREKIQKWTVCTAYVCSRLGLPAEPYHPAFSTTLLEPPSALAGTNIADVERRGRGEEKKDEGSSGSAGLGQRPPLGAY